MEVQVLSVLKWVQHCPHSAIASIILVASHIIVIATNSCIAIVMFVALMFHCHPFLHCQWQFVMFVSRFDLGRPLPLHFLRRASKAGGVDSATHTLAK